MCIVVDIRAVMKSDQKAPRAVLRCSTAQMAAVSTAESLSNDCVVRECEAVLVADCCNCRVVRWQAGAREGEVVGVQEGDEHPGSDRERQPGEEDAS